MQYFSFVYAGYKRILDDATLGCLDKGMIKKVRSMATIPKCILFAGVVGSTWFFGKEEWFNWLSPLLGVSGIEWVYSTTFLVAFLLYWLFFGLKKRD